MTNFTAVFNRVSDKLGVDANQIIPHFGNLWNLYSKDKLFLTTKDEDGDMTVYYFRRSLVFKNEWRLETVHDPIKRFSFSVFMTEEDALVEMLSLMYNGAVLEEYSLSKHADYIRFDKAYWLTAEHDIIVISNGKETMTIFYSYKDECWYVDNNILEVADIDNALADAFKNDFKVIFTGTSSDAPQEVK